MLSLCSSRIKEEIFRIFLVLIWGEKIIFKYARAILLRIPYVRYIADYVFPLLVVSCIILSFSYLIKRISWKDISFFLVFLGVYFLHLIVYPKNSEFLMSIGSSFFTSVFSLYFVGLCVNTKKDLKIIYSTSIVNIWMFVIYTVFISDGIQIEQAIYSGSMHSAYMLLPNLLIVVGYMLKEINVLNIISTVAGVVFLLMCGNRGSVLLLITFVVIFLAFGLKKAFRIRTYLAVVSIYVTITILFDNIIAVLREIFLNLGMSQRVITMYIAGEFFESNGRNEIANSIIQAIYENPLLGYGMTADRTIAGSYAHNFALEIFVSFGLFVGTIILIATVYIIIQAWRFSHEIEHKIFLLSLICVGFIKLFISSSYLLESMFFFLLGFSVGCIRGKIEDKKEGRLNEDL